MDQVKILLTIKNLEDIISRTTQGLAEMEEAQSQYPRDSDLYIYLSKNIDECMATLERMETEIYNLSQQATPCHYELLN